MNDSPSRNTDNRRPGQWHYVVNGETLGPADEVELARQAEKGLLGPDTLVWQQGMDSWAPAGTTELARLLPANRPTPARPSSPDVDETRLRNHEPKLAAFRDPRSPLAQAISATAGPPAPQPVGECAPPPPRKGNRALVLGLCLAIPIIAVLAAILWFFGPALSRIKLF